MNTPAGEKATYDQRYRHDYIPLQGVGEAKARAFTALYLRAATHYGRYFEIVKSFYERVRRPLRVLELGCGPGCFADSLVSGGIAVEYTGIDVSSTAIEKAGAKNLSGCRFIEADLFTHDYAGSTFDVVFTSAVVEHVDDPLELFDLMKQRTAPGGMIIAGYPSVEYYRFWYFPFYVFRHLTKRTFDYHGVDGMKVFEYLGPKGDTRVDTATFFPPRFYFQFIPEKVFLPLGRYLDFLRTLLAPSGINALGYFQVLVHGNPDLPGFAGPRGYPRMLCFRKLHFGVAFYLAALPLLVCLWGRVAMRRLSGGGKA